MSDDESVRVVIRHAMELAAERGWHGLGMAAVAQAAGLPLGELYRRCPTRASILAALSRQADRDVLADTGSAPDDAGETPRDRLFDVMMRRFDALAPYRAGLAAVMRDLPREPVTALVFSRAFARSMAWMLRAAGIDPDAPGGAVLVAGLGLVHTRTMRVFLNDDTADMARTMAALDAGLRRAESWAGALPRCRARRPSRMKSGPAAPSEGTAAAAG